MNINPVVTATMIMNNEMQQAQNIHNQLGNFQNIVN